MPKKPTRLPYMQLYFEEWLSDPRIVTLGAVARSGLFQLILALWQMRGRLPQEDSVLLRMSWLTAEEWAEHSPSILQHFSTDEDGQLIHDTYTPLYDKTVVKVEKRKAAAESRWKSKTDAHANAYANASTESMHMQRDARSIYISKSESPSVSSEDFQATLDTLKDEHPGSCKPQLAAQYLSQQTAKGHDLGDIIHHHRDAQKVWADGRMPPDLENWLATYDPDNKLVPPPARNKENSLVEEMKDW